MKPCQVPILKNWGPTRFATSRALVFLPKQTLELSEPGDSSSQDSPLRDLG